MDTRRHGYSVRPTRIDPVDLFRQVSEALGVRWNDPLEPGRLVRLPMPDLSAPNFRDQYLLKELLRKYPGFDLGVDRAAVAINSLMDQESRNRVTNDRLAKRSYGENPRVRQCYLLAARKAADILGGFDPGDLLEGSRFGPGATSRIRGKSVDLTMKLTGKQHVTLSAMPLAYWYLSECPYWAFTLSPCVTPADMFIVCEHDRVISVSKNALTDRTIAPQPDMNVLLQLGAGYGLRKRLYAAGVNLNDQSINQRRALLGSRTGTLATVDISGASNSLTCQLVYDLIGNHDHTRTSAWQWFTVMDSLRTTSGWIGTVDHLYELFSSMGNGFTFELESLVFFCLASSVCAVLEIPEDVTVYGDDIILPTEAVSLLREVLSFCGFEFNSAKSFWSTSGPLFRESCGRHYLDGIDVTPFYVDEELITPESIVLLANNLVRWARMDYGLDGRLEPVWRWVVSHLTETVQNTAIPFGEANDGLIKDFDVACPSVRYTCASPAGEIVQGTCVESLKNGSTLVSKRGIHLDRMRIGYECRTFELQNRRKAPTDEAGLLIWHYLRGHHRFNPVVSPWYNAEPYTPYKVRGLKMSYRTGRRVVTSWPVIGPWLS